jgi:anaerobic ribonucleoside-triphosphate reductase activating protein
MNILYVDFTLKHKSLDIYTAGCKGLPHCKNCHNPESWSFDQGDKFNDKIKIKIKNYIEDFNIIENIMIFGGEPLDNDITELLDFFNFLKTFDKQIWLFTHYELNEINDEIKNKCNYIKTGRYIPELSIDNNLQYGIKLATSNQQIFKI